MTDDIISVEWNSSRKLQKLEFFLALLLIVALIIIAIIFPAQQLLAGISFAMLMVWFAIALADSISERNLFVEHVGLGKDTKITFVVFLGAILLAVIFQTFSLQTTTLLFLASTAPSITNLQTDWNLIWVGLVFAIVEEMLWRNTFIPTLNKLTGMKWFSIIFGNLTFAIAHLSAVTLTLTAKYGVVTPENLLLILFSDFAFGMVCSIFNGMSKTTAFGYGFHISNNVARLVRGVL